MHAAWKSGIYSEFDAIRRIKEKEAELKSTN
jgi:hypothetical protein